MKRPANGQDGETSAAFNSEGSVPDQDQAVRGSARWQPREPLLPGRVHPTGLVNKSWLRAKPWNAPESRSAQASSAEARVHAPGRKSRRRAPCTHLHWWSIYARCPRNRKKKESSTLEAGSPNRLTAQPQGADSYSSSSAHNLPDLLSVLAKPHLPLGCRPQRGPCLHKFASFQFLVI
jgi:hypothetical protein